MDKATESSFLQNTWKFMNSFSILRSTGWKKFLGLCLLKKKKEEDLKNKEDEQHSVIFALKFLHHHTLKLKRTEKQFQVLVQTCIYMVVVFYKTVLENHLRLFEI